MRQHKFSEIMELQLCGGGELYPIIQEKMKSGYVYPKGLKDLLRSYGFEVIYCRGNMNALKYEIRNGNQVIIIFEGVNPAIVKMMERLTPEIVQQLKELSTVEPRGIISASTNFSDGRMSEKGRTGPLYWRAFTCTRISEF